ncbi:MAG: DciA family protein [Pseudomonadota bacterium]
MPPPRSASKSDPGEKRTRRLRALAATLPKVTARTIGRRGFAEAGLINEWPAIVGRDIADQCRPRSLTYPRRERRQGGILSLKVAPAFALEIQHMEPVLIERINRYYGYRAVGQLKLKQGPLPAPKPRTGKQEPTLSASEEAALKLRLSEVEDPALRIALERLGRGLAAKSVHKKL